MWQVRIQKIRPGSTHTFHILDEKGQALSKRQFLNLLTQNEGFRSFFNAIIAECPFPAVYFETPAWQSNLMAAPFSGVLIHADRLAQVRPDSHAFQAHFSLTEPVVTFPNLGHNAMLVVPCPITDNLAYPHLAAFTRLAPASQQDAFWQAAGVALVAEIGEAPRWFSTAGMGVPWLHIRIDQRPKYYRYSPFRAVH